MHESQPDIRNRRQALLAIARYKDPRQGPGYTDTDIGLLKNIHVTESKYLQFRSDFLNAFNNVQLGHPNTNFPSCRLSDWSMLRSPQGNIQFALKFYY